jgi:hypothetical protein
MADQILPLFTEVAFFVDFKLLEKVRRRIPLL